MEKTKSNQKELKNLMGIIDYTKQLYPNTQAEKKAQKEQEQKNKINYETKMNIQSRLYYANQYIDSLNNIIRDMENFFDLDQTDDGIEILGDLETIKTFIPHISSGINSINEKLEASE